METEKKKKNKKHRDCLILWRVSVHTFITLFPCGQRDPSVWLSQQDTFKLRNITAHNQPIKTASWSFVRYFQSVRFCNANPGTSNRSFQMELKLKNIVLQCCRVLGFHGKTSNFCIHEVSQIHIDSFVKAFISQLLWYIFVSSLTLCD